MSSLDKEPVSGRTVREVQIIPAQLGQTVVSKLASALPVYVQSGTADAEKSRVSAAMHGRNGRFSNVSCLH